MTRTPPTWRPPRLTPHGLDFAGLAPPGHLIVGVLATQPSDSAIVHLDDRRADQTLVAEVLAVGDRCPGVEVGNRVVIQRFSGAGRLFDGMGPLRTRNREDGGMPSSGLNPDWLGEHGAPLARFSAIQIVRCGNAIPAQRDGVDTALVATSLVVQALRAMIKEGEAKKKANVKAAAKAVAKLPEAARRDVANVSYKMDDMKGEQARARLATFEKLLAVVLKKREGRAVNSAVLAAGLSTGDDGAAFDGVIAVVEP